jgi:GNAT superfamily N-acetyltransferase
MQKLEPSYSRPLPGSPPGSPAAGELPSLASYRSYEATDREAIVDLLSTGRPSGYWGAKSALFDWQFRQNPHSDGSSPFLVGVVPDGRIVALNGFMPARILFHRRAMLARWSCDTYVSPDHRGQGFGKELVKRVSDAAPVMLGYGISDMSDPIFHKHEWLLHPNIVLLFHHVAEAGIFGRFKNFGTRFARGVREKTCASDPIAREIVCDDHTPCSAEVDELWDASKAGYLSCVERDAAYLNWKYDQHPLHRYLCYSARHHGRLQGLMIARHDPEESVIVDYAGPAEDTSLMFALAGFAVEDLARRETVRIRCETTHPPMLDALSRAGFLASRHVSRFRVRSNTPPLDSLEILDGWFLMPGDSDNDLMPVLDAGS